MPLEAENSTRPCRVILATILSWAILDLCRFITWPETHIHCSDTGHQKTIMPRSGLVKSPHLGLEINDPRPAYLPGDTINGRILRVKSLGADKTQHVVRVSIFGRTKSKYTTKSNNGTTIRRGRASLFHIQKTMTFSASDKLDYPFEITIPTTSMPGMTSRGDCFEPNACYLHTTDTGTTKESDITKHGLPTSIFYFCTSAMSGKTSEAFIEYILEADFAGVKISLPIFVRRRSTLSPITDHKLTERSALYAVKTLRLLPEFAEGPIPFRRKMSATLSSSKMPGYTHG